MFEDRSNKGKYDFKKYDKIARTQVLTEEKKPDKNETLAHKKLFNYSEKPEEKEQEESILKHIENTGSLNELPSSKYLKSFENQVISEPEIVSEVKEEENSTKEVDIEALIDTSNVTRVDEKLVKKELENVTPKPKKSYSFRIKLVAGVYCILVALFGGWVIGNAVDLAQTNANIYETVAESEEINQSILEIVSNINNLNNASSDPNDETILKKIVTEEIPITPEEIVAPTEYKAESNWFDAFCNWLFGIFGGK